MAEQREPNPGHRAVVELERRGVLDALVTQNIDGLHQAAGLDPAKVIEIHGTMREVVCLGCGARGRPSRRSTGSRPARTIPPASSAGAC